MGLGSSDVQLIGHTDRLEKAPELHRAHGGGRQHGREEEVVVWAHAYHFERLCIDDLGPRAKHLSAFLGAKEGTSWHHWQAA